MAKKKKILVSDLLELMDESENVCVVYYAYGVYYGDTVRDGMKTVNDCKQQLRHDCLNALVTGIKAGYAGKEEEGYTIIHAEIVH